MNGFFEDIKMFSIKGISMIGNLTNGALAGLTPNGEKLIQSIVAGKSIDTELLDTEQKQLFSFLQQNGFLFGLCAPAQKVKGAYIHVNSKCNLHCKGCYSYVDHRNECDELPITQWFDILDQLSKLDYQNLIISGGEPILRKDLLEILKYAKEKAGIKRLALISNGTMQSQMYDGIIPYLDCISISIDGYNENVSFIRDSGIMPTVLSTVRYLKEKIPVQLIVTLHKKNVVFMHDYQELAEKLGVIMTYSIFTVDETANDFSEYLFDEDDFVQIGQTVANSGKPTTIMDSPMEKVGLNCRSCCGFGNSLISIGYNGNVYPCHMLHYDDCIMGNVATKSLKEILSVPDFDTRDISVDKVTGCKSCDYKYICGGGCRGRSFLKYKDFAHKDPYCKAAIKFYDDTFLKLQKLADNHVPSKAC